MSTKFIIAAIVVGVSLIGYSLTLEPYRNQKEFEFRYGHMGAGQSEAFYQLREEMVTPKYRSFDTGVTILLLAILCGGLLISGNGRVKSPPNKISYVGLALVAPLISAKGYAFDLHQGYLRNEFPHWADTLAIPLAFEMPLLVILLAWSLLHLVLLRDPSARSLSSVASRKFNSWLALISIVTGLIMLISAYYGQYWYAVPAALWVYYYLSIGMSRMERSET